MSTIELKGLKALQQLEGGLDRLPDTKSSVEYIQNLPIDLLITGKYQPRKYISETALNELADSIKQQGIIQPLIVRKIDHKAYEIIAGERRWRAAKIAGLKTVPAIVRNIEDNIAMVFALIENIQRESLNPIEEAEAYSRFKEEFLMTHSEIAEIVGKSRTSITNTMRLLFLTEPVRGFLIEGKLDMGHARAILNLEPEQQILLAQKIIEEKLTVREAEKLASDLKLRKIEVLKTINLYKEKNDLWSTILSEKLASKVRVNLNEKGSGKISIYVDSPQEIEWIINHIRVN